MQSFLPYADFAASARVLDARRLGKQRVETIQILRGLTISTYGWRHHPAVKMWAGYEEGLVRYGLEICAAWTASGRADTCQLTLLTDLKSGCGLDHVRTQQALAEAGDLPPWLGDEDFHRSHRSALLSKDPQYYGALFDDPPELPYVWPASDRRPCHQG
ncbi:putative cytoplasmic protein [Kribbella flavida DSM 17836]|uniref:Putative cytoplasmic protein n=1 Tax=Kribbella flavida (strain DSM 17836 / JCM 10339 / NBRC 14399) TaxID=479435 RepID=D2PPP8_KRIFD|nr:MSMEG_6728 family protein [Kribbella flavida]ADB31010.1 putative cytoplasmic protein [Kribbella flavida DSM 17836]